MDYMGGLVFREDCHRLLEVPIEHEGEEEVSWNCAK